MSLKVLYARSVWALWVLSLVFVNLRDFVEGCNQLSVYLHRIFCDSNRQSYTVVLILSREYQN